ncbi:substrate-binding domain-containing protein [Balneatrix alpica]|uniref:Substrate-binding domain-containing protein n=1 Tax=Balneatrix alpica TaxID=75684 RepID=A0ABV5ZAM9_9GAMM|nr:substrate-binding domain-containing protein [Balneatrix alpica]
MLLRLVLMLLCLPLPSWAAPLNAVGISVSDMGNPFFVELARRAEQRAKQLGGPQVRVYVSSSAYDLQRQQQQLQQFIAAGVELILVAAADEEAIEPSIRAAQQAGIIVIAVDVKAKGADASVTTDNLQAGELACQALAEQLGGQGKIAIINGPPVSSVLERVQGCQQVLSQYPQLELLSSDLNAGGNQAGGLEKMTALLTAFPQIDGVFTTNDPTALGAEQAALQSGRTSFVISSVDGAPSALARMAEGDSLLIGSAAQYPGRIAVTAVEVGQALLNGAFLAEPNILIPAQLITPVNVSQAPGWFAQEP